MLSSSPMTCSNHHLWLSFLAEYRISPILIGFAKDLAMLSEEMHSVQRQASDGLSGSQGSVVIKVWRMPSGTGSNVPYGEVERVQASR